MSRGRKERHACSVIGTRQSREMESSCAGAPLARDPENIDLPGKQGSGKPLLPTHSRHQRQERGGRQPRAWGHGKPTCRRRRLPSSGEKGSRRPARPSSSSRRRQLLANIRQQESASLSQGKTAYTDVPHTVCPGPGAGEQVDRGGCRSVTAETDQVELPPTDPETREGAKSHTCGFRRQLIRLLKDGWEYFTPEEVSPLVRAARLGVKGSLNVINMLKEDVRYFENVSPNAGEGKLQEQCPDTIREYEESMRVWEEMKDTGNLCTRDTARKRRTS